MEGKKPNLHKGHRSRLKQRYMTEGLSGFHEHEILELLLFFAIPYKDTNEIAHRLLDEFKTIPAVLRANPDYLKSFKNITDNSVILLKLLGDISRRYQKNEGFKPRTITNQTELEELMYDSFREINAETVLLFLLEGKNKVVDCIKLHEGKDSISEVKVGDIARIANTRGISRVMVAHNHPDSSPISTNDIVSTRKIAYHLNGVDIDLCESYVLTLNKVIGIVEMTRQGSRKTRNKRK